MDMREREVALKLRSRLRELERTHRRNVTKALDTAALAQSAFTFEAKQALEPYLEAAVDALFAELREVLEQRIVTPLLTQGAAATDRHHKLHGEILDQLKRDAAERAAFEAYRDPSSSPYGGGDASSLNDEAGEGLYEGSEYDEAAVAKRDEEWRAEVVAHFIESFDRHFNDTAAHEAEGLEPRALLTPSDAVYRDLVDVGDRLGFPSDYLSKDPSSNESVPEDQLTWRDAEARLAAMGDALAAKRCPPFTPSDPPDDDAYDYMQLHNVEHYVSEMRWQAKLNEAHGDIKSHLAAYKAGQIDSMDLMTTLEAYEGDRAFPSFWLFHSPAHWDDYHYGDW